MSTLYELSSTFRQILDIIEKDEDYKGHLEDTLESVECMLEEKAENIINLMKYLESQIDMFKDEEKRLNDRRKTMENKKERLKEYLSSTLKANKINRLNAGTYTISFRKGVDKVEVVDVNKIPDKYKIPQEPKVDKKTLLKELKAGKQIDGAILKIATDEDRTISIR